RRAQRRLEQPRKKRGALPQEPPQLTPEAALALLRVLLKARTAREHQQGHPPVRGHPLHSTTDPEGEGVRWQTRRSDSHPGTACRLRIVKILSPPGPGSTPAAKP